MALMGLKVGMSVVHHLSERHKMKKRDKEIEQEREKERQIEKSQLDRKITINHFSHEHPLEKVHLSKSFSCNICHVSSSPSSWAYTCKVDNCSYFLHAVCAASPVTLRPNISSSVGRDPPRPATGGSSSITTFAHHHAVKDVHSNLEFQCNHCFTTGKGRRYKCEDCDVNLHPVCANNPTRLSSFMHPQHELELRTKKRFKACQICGRHSLRSGQKAFNLRVYGCDECKFWVHPMCSQLPQYLLHDLHPMTDPLHPLQLKRVESSTATQCDANCGSKCRTGWQYVCTLCSVSFHIECILKHSVQDSSVQNKSNKSNQFFHMTSVFLQLVDAAGFGVVDIAASLWF